MRIKGIAKMVRAEIAIDRFAFGSLDGIPFVQQNGASAVNCISHGHGTEAQIAGFITEKNLQLNNQSGRVKTQGNISR